VTIVQGFGTHGWSQYFAYFAQLSLASKGAPVTKAQYSGATYAAAAFNNALASAMSKF
jgi:hypothetical protein